MSSVIELLLRLCYIWFSSFYMCGGSNHSVSSCVLLYGIVPKSCLIFDARCLKVQGGYFPLVSQSVSEWVCPPPMDSSGNQTVSQSKSRESSSLSAHSHIRNEMKWIVMILTCTINILASELHRKKSLLLVCAQTLFVHTKNGKLKMM